MIPLSFITGQLIHMPNLKKAGVDQNEVPQDQHRERAKKIIYGFFVLFVTMGLIANTAPTILVMYSWISGSVTVFNVTYIFNVPKIDNTTNKIPSIVLRELPTKGVDAYSLSDSTTEDNLNEFEAFAKLVMAFFAIASSISFWLFLGSLLCTYKRKNNGQNPPLDPFQFNIANTSTQLDLKESIYFISLLLLNLLLWIGCSGYFSGLHFKAYYTGNGFKSNAVWAEATVFAMYMYSVLCTIVSCFIFSKIAHSVTHRCQGQLKTFADHQRQEGEEDSGVGRLIENDLGFTKMAQASIVYFEFWFTVHWLFYTVTSFLSIALFLDMLRYYMQSSYHPSTDTAIGFSFHELSVVGLFTLQHCFLFLYPCFKAAAVTVGREKLIKKVNAHPLDNEQLSLEKKQLYIQHLKQKKFGFRISFFCARLRFGFNVAYISIFIGLLGVLLKLTGVF